MVPFIFSEKSVNQKKVEEVISQVAKEAARKMDVLNEKCATDKVLKEAVNCTKVVNETMR